jgi:hypothetical protein
MTLNYEKLRSIADAYGMTVQYFLVILKESEDESKTGYAIKQMPTA